MRTPPGHMLHKALQKLLEMTRSYSSGERVSGLQGLRRAQGWVGTWRGYQGPHEGISPPWKHSTSSVHASVPRVRSTAVQQGASIGGKWAENAGDLAVSFPIT